MITDARVLQPDFVPAEIKHRSAELTHITNTLLPLLSNTGHPQPSFLYGPSGAGKTCIARYTLNKLREEAVNVTTQYVNCWEDYSRFKTLYRILEGIDRTFDVHRQSTPQDALLDRIKAYDGGPYVVILDEVDQLEDKDLLYNLHRVPHLTLILIANRTEEVFELLDTRVLSRLQDCIQIRFSRYDTSELTAILEDRARWGLTEDAIATEQLRMIADHAGGDARVAIGILRTATHQAQQQGAETITDQMIETAVPEARSEIRQKTVDRLTEHQQVLYDVITDAGEIGASDLYAAYRERVTDPKTKRTMRNYLQKLERYNLITAQGKTKGRTYQPQA